MPLGVSPLECVRLPTNIAIFPSPCYHPPMDSTLQSTKFTAVLDAQSPLFIGFKAIDPDMVDYFRWVSVEPATWRDMGSPDVITVTIEPGDRLNER